MLLTWFSEGLIHFPCCPLPIHLQLPVERYIHHTFPKRRQQRNTASMVQTPGTGHTLPPSLLPHSLPASPTVFWSCTVLAVGDSMVSQLHVGYWGKDRYFKNEDIKCKQQEQGSWCQRDTQSPGTLSEHKPNYNKKKKIKWSKLLSAVGRKWARRGLTTGKRPMLISMMEKSVQRLCQG